MKINKFTGIIFRLFCIFIIISHQFCFAQNLVKNAEFDDGLDGWYVGQYNGAIVEYSIDDSGLLSGENSLFIDIWSGGYNRWNVMVNTQINPQNGEEYLIQFKAMSSEEIVIDVICEKIESPYTRYFSQTVTVDDYNQTFGPFIWECNSSDETINLSFQMGNQDGVFINIDSVIVKQIDYAPPPVADFTGSPRSGTAPLIVDFNDQSSG